MSLVSRGPSSVTNEETDSKEDSVSHVQNLEALRLKPKSPEERQLSLQAALKIDPGVNAWSVRAMYFYLVVLCAFCCSGDNGFDATVMSGINTMAQYQ